MPHSSRWLALVLILLVVIALAWSLGARGLAVLPAPCRARFPLSLLGQDKAQELGISLTPPTFPDTHSGKEITLFVNGSTAAIITPPSVTALSPVTLTVKGTTIAGWLLKDVLAQSLPATSLEAQTQVTIGSSSSNHAVQFSWAELQAANSNIILALPATNSWLLAFPLDSDQSKDAWVQVVDRIKVNTAAASP